MGALNKFRFVHQEPKKLVRVEGYCKRFIDGWGGNFVNAERRTLMNADFLLNLK